MKLAAADRQVRKQWDIQDAVAVEPVDSPAAAAADWKRDIRQMQVDSQAVADSQIILDLSRSGRYQQEVAAAAAAGKPGNSEDLDSAAAAAEAVLELGISGSDTASQHRRLSSALVPGCHSPAVVDSGHQPADIPLDLWPITPPPDT